MWVRQIEAMEDGTVYPKNLNIVDIGESGGFFGWFITDNTLTLTGTGKTHDYSHMENVSWYPLKGTKNDDKQRNISIKFLRMLQTLFRQIFLKAGFSNNSGDPFFVFFPDR